MLEGLEKMEWEKYLKKIYSTPGESTAFSSAEKIHRLLKSKQYSVTKKQVQNWLNQQYVYTIHKARKYNFPRNPVLASNIDDNWQADILFLPDIKNYNDNKPCMLACIDVITRYGFAVPMMSKSGADTTKAFAQIIASSGRKPERLQTDKGGEFFNWEFKDLLKTMNITLYSTESDKKAAIAERFIKELKKMIYLYLDKNQTNRYIDVLPDIVKSYNNTYHSSIKMAPSEVNEENLKIVLKNLYGHLWETDAIPINQTKRLKEKFAVGDKVRISLSKKVFSKGYKGFWTTEIFTIETVKYNFPHIQYRLKTENGEVLKGLFYEEELQKVDPLSARFTKIKTIFARKKIKKREWVLVNWENEDPNLKRWIPADVLHNVSIYLTLFSSINVVSFL